MFSRRGRKQNNNLPPSRARDAQRAFRERRTVHLKNLEQRIDQLEEENKNYRKALNLPPSSRPSLGRGPTGQNHPDRDTDKSRCQTVSPSHASAGSVSSCPSSPELGQSPIAPSRPSYAVTMDFGPPQHRNEHHAALSQGHFIQQSISIFAPTPLKPSSPPNRSDHILPPLCSAIYSQSSEEFTESNFDVRERREEVRHDFKPDYPSSDQYLPRAAASTHSQSLHVPNLSHCREWNPPSFQSRPHLLGPGISGKSPISSTSRSGTRPPITSTDQAGIIPTYHMEPNT